MKMGKITEMSAESRYIQTCKEQGWNEDSQIIHLEGFIRGKGLFEEFAAYAAKAAEEENDSGVQCVVDDVLERTQKYGFQPEKDMVRDAVEESANLLSIELSEQQIVQACERIMQSQDLSSDSQQPQG
jgi:hypothetical protein